MHGFCTFKYFFPSYENLFWFFCLLFFLAEPHAGFRIAFNMFDTDGNEMVDKKEFLVVCTLYAAFS
jgi:hypothetical protein